MELATVPFVRGVPHSPPGLAHPHMESPRGSLAVQVLQRVEWYGRGRSSQSSTESTSSGPPQQPDIRVGQIVTTTQGLKGRVLRVADGEVQLEVPGSEEPQLVDTGDLRLLKLVFLGGHGFHRAKRTDRMQLFCSCLVLGETSSEVHTPVAPARATALWQHEVDLLGHNPGDSVAIRLWGRDPATHANNLLGEATLPVEMSRFGGFNTELQLSMDGQSLPTYLSVMAIDVSTPRSGKRPNEHSTSVGKRVS